MKIKGLILVAAIAGISICASAQDYVKPAHLVIPPMNDSLTPKPSTYLAINVGPGFPFGKYHDSAFVKTGYTICLTGATPFKNKRTGDCFKIDYGANAIDGATFMEAFQTDLIHSTGASGITCKAPILGKFSYETILVGLYSTFPGIKASFDGRIMGGVLLAQSPDISVNVYQNGNLVVTSTQPASKGGSFAVDLGLGMHYRVQHNLCVLAYLDVLFANPDFAVSATAFGPSGNGGVTSVTINGDVHQPYDLINITVGIGWIK